MKRCTGWSIGAILVLAVTLAGCDQTAPAPATTSPPAVPAKAAEPTKALPPATAPTRAPEVAAKKSDYPAGKPITYIVTWQAGSGADLSSRALASYMEKELGTTIQIVNDGAASTQSGLTKIATAKPDGYFIGQSTLPTNITSYLDPTRGAIYTRSSFQPIAGYAVNTVGVTVRSDSPYKTLKDLVDAAKAKPGEIKMGTSGIMAIGHLAILMLEKATGAKFQLVQFPGGEGGITALLGGHVDVYCTGVMSSIPQYKTGELRILATSDHERDKHLQEVPTYEEQGYAVYITNMFGMIAPAGTPMEIVNMLSKGVKTGLETDDVRQRLAGAALTPRYLDPAQFGDFWANRENEIRPLLEMIRQ